MRMRKNLCQHILNGVKPGKVALSHCPTTIHLWHFNLNQNELNLYTRDRQKTPISASKFLLGAESKYRDQKFRQT